MEDENRGSRSGEQSRRKDGAESSGDAGIPVGQQGSFDPGMNYQSQVDQQGSFDPEMNYVQSRMNAQHHMGNMQGKN
ncbi:uncharacterized protein LOC143861066 [Tasmannia lanceolata]|uniref:uncharacterized protein LOC143861066 n=1 Tax=Tasmannia lanceolata TaxID=3420 RepID=UPI004063E0FF